MTCPQTRMLRWRSSVWHAVCLEPTISLSFGRCFARGTRDWAAARGAIRREPLLSPAKRRSRQVLFSFGRTGLLRKSRSAIGDDSRGGHSRPRPAHLLLCEVAATACRHADLNPAALPQRNTGVYIGHGRASGMTARMNHGLYIAQTARYLREVVGFEQLADGLGSEIIAEVIGQVRRDSPQRHADGGPLLAVHMAAGLIAKTLGLNGPQMTMNAACASSSQALAQGAPALQFGRVDMAIVGGASYFLSDTLVMFCQAQSVSATGSRPFDADADGMIVAEGYVALLLKTLERALADESDLRRDFRRRHLLGWARQDPLGPAQGRPDRGHSPRLLRRRPHGSPRVHRGPRHLNPSGRRHGNQPP